MLIIIGVSTVTDKKTVIVCASVLFLVALVCFLWALILFRQQIRLKGKRLQQGYTPDFKKSFDNVLRDQLSVLSKKLETEPPPQLILGISGEQKVGGLIIGAWLASHSFLKRTEMFRQVFRNKELSDELKQEIADKNVQKILLVDDTSESGATVKKVLNRIRKANPNVEIRVAVIIVRHESWERHDKRCTEHSLQDCTNDCPENIWGEGGIGVYCYPDVPNFKPEIPSTDVHWPWET